MSAPADLRCEWMAPPVPALCTTTPRLSWRPPVDLARQTGFELEAEVEGRPTFRTGPVTSDRNTGVAWPGPQLSSRDVARWRVRLLGEEDSRSDWSEWVEFEIGLMEAADWSARWISPDDDPKPAERPAPQLRTEFALDGGFQRARLFASAQGVYRATLNGRPVSEEQLRPGWTAYRSRLQYQVYDVGSLLDVGANCLAVTLADGWWRGEVTGGRVRNAYGDRLAMIAQLEVDGRIVLASGEGWRWATGGVRGSDLFRGEQYDARLDTRGWTLPGFDDSAWAPAPVVDLPTDRLIAQRGPGVRVVEERAPVSAVRSSRGTTVLDFGENIVGRVRVPLPPDEGGEVRLIHAETLDGDEPSVKHLRLPTSGPLQEGRYVGDGDVHDYEPMGSTAGFRYVGLHGLDPERARDARAVLLQSPAPVIGSFGCSDPRLEQLHRVILRTISGNLVEVPTDCPTRERAGWTGDLQAIAATATFTMDLTALLERWLGDLAAEQGPDGRVPDLVPWVRAIPILPPAGTGSVGWGDAATLVPEILYGVTGDPGVLEAQLSSMVAWVGYLETRAARGRAILPFIGSGRATGHRAHVLDTGFQWGDHYQIGRESIVRLLKRFVRVPALVATAFFARSAQAVADAAEVLGRDAERERHQALRARIGEAFAQEFLSGDGRLTPDDQASYVLALAFDLVPEQLRPAAVGHLVRLIRAAGNHATTGFLATPHLLPVLADNGHADVAYDVLLNTEAPSWLSMLERGATTVWESLDAVGADGRTKFRSLNHYTFGCVGDFLHRYVAGLDVSRIGLGRMRVDPHPGGGLSGARAEFRSVHGTARAAWERDGSSLDVEIVVPPNVTATVGAGADAIEVGPGSHRVRLPAG